MEKVEAKVDLRSMQEQVEDRVKAVGGFGRRARLIYLGLFGLAYDTGSVWMRDSRKFLDKAERRGLKLEKEFNSTVAEMRKEAMGEARKMRSQVGTRMESVTKEVTSRGEAMEREVQRALERVKAGGVNGKTAKIDEIRIEVEVAEQPLIEGYDQLTADEVIERIKPMDAETLLQVRAYEIAHKNRVTVLRAVDAELGQRAAVSVGEALEPPVPGYNEMTVDEVTALVPTLDERQLTTLRTYEATHKNRVTVLRAVDDEFAARAKAEARPEA